MGSPSKYIFLMVYEKSNRLRDVEEFNTTSPLRELFSASALGDAVSSKALKQASDFCRVLHILWFAILAGSPIKIYVTWVTLSNVSDSKVQFGETKLNKEVNGNRFTLIEGGSINHIRYRIGSHISARTPRSIKCFLIQYQLFTKYNSKVEMSRCLLYGAIRYIHRVLLNSLKYSTSYVYRVGGRWGWSNLYYFKTLSKMPANGYKFAVYGGLGNENAISLPYIQNEAQHGRIDMILHIGDIAYDMFERNGTRGDQFFKQIEPAAAYVPYMACPGDHEERYNFSHFANRFTFPNSNGNLFYSFDVGNIHMIMYNTEFYFYTKYGTEQIKNQYEWLERDLQIAQSNRDIVPWIIVMGHRPLYCSDSTNNRFCTKQNTIIREGVPPDQSYGVELLWNKYGVDLAISAHCHYYERLYPIYNYTLYKGVMSPYTDPAAITQISVAAAGNSEEHERFDTDAEAWSSWRTTDFGYTRLHVFNDTHLHMQLVSTEKAGLVVDSFWLIKNIHQSYVPLQVTRPGVDVRQLFHLE